LSLEKLIAVARDKIPADLLLSDARIINTFTAEIESGNVAVCQGRIAGIGDYSKAERTIDLKGKYLAPGLINGHIHIESSMLHIAEYARAVVPRGTSAIVTDLHEIANVAGLKGIRYLMNCSRTLPLDCYFMAPPCVPATHLETAGAELGQKEIRACSEMEECHRAGRADELPGRVDA